MGNNKMASLFDRPAVIFRATLSKILIIQLSLTIPLELPE